VVKTYRSSDWSTYVTDYGKPHEEVEDLDHEIAVVDEALDMLREAGILPHSDYDHAKMLAHREAVRETFEIPWTAITPRMQRLLYAINAIAQPRNMIAAGVFCGFTFISNAGAGVGPGACYAAENLIGVEIVPDEARRAERNVRHIDATGVARVLAADAIEFVAEFDRPIDLLYLDADGMEGRGKKIYLDILQACFADLPEGALILAHNNVSHAEQLAEYLGFVHDEANCRASVNVILDTQGVEVSAK
jgi:predicted O-methyltransferase YrrM